MMRELEALRAVTDNASRPYVLIMGGAKVSDKIGVLKNMISKVDTILIGGAMAYTFLKARGVATGKSLVADEKLRVAAELEAQAKCNRVALVLPIDHVVADAPSEGATGMVVTEIPAGKMGLDIGPRTVVEFIAHLKGAKTIVWNGPLRYFELPAFAQGTLKVGEAVALSGATSLLGGGDTEAAVAKAPWVVCFTHISTGGGATLEYLEGRELPGVQALEQ